MGSVILQVYISQWARGKIDTQTDLHATALASNRLCRIAIGTHRARRKKELVRNPLDEIPGIGPARKRAILHHFGSAKVASTAAVEDLMLVDGVSEAMAKRIHGFFQKG